MGKNLLGLFGSGYFRLLPDVNGTEGWESFTTELIEGWELFTNVGIVGTFKGGKYIGWLSLIDVNAEIGGRGKAFM